MRRRSCLCRRRTVDGSILIEVLVALVLVSIALGPLSMSAQTARDRSREIVSNGEALSPFACLDSNAAAWSWGPRIVGGAWRPGQRLDLLVDADPLSGAVVGLWTDGWLIATLQPLGDGSLSADVGHLGGREGAELVARVRLGGQTWGPAWHTIVPAMLEGGARSLAPAHFSEGGALYPAAVVVHVGSVSNPLLEVSGGSATASRDVTGLPFYLVPVTEGALEVRLNAIPQSFMGEEARALDLYF